MSYLWRRYLSRKKTPIAQIEEKRLMTALIHNDHENEPRFWVITLAVV
jgi:hypothetical protein